jgi:hypothetical protein
MDMDTQNYYKGGKFKKKQGGGAGAKLMMKVK